jgi:CCR4-NOT transcription complex subunit 1
MFAEIKNTRLQEIATRVLLERLMVFRPHPWGALVTFIELLRNPRYDFWNKDFVRIAPEISMLLDRVSDDFSQTTQFTKLLSFSLGGAINGLRDT